MQRRANVPNLKTLKTIISQAFDSRKSVADVNNVNTYASVNANTNVNVNVSASAGRRIILII